MDDASFATDSGAIGEEPIAVALLSPARVTAPPAEVAAGTGTMVELHVCVRVPVTVLTFAGVHNELRKVYNAGL